MRLTSSVYLVGAGDASVGISSQWDCNVYLIHHGSGYWLVDAGYTDVDRLCRNIEDDGLDPGAISRILTTHYHADHVGNLAAWRRRLGHELTVVGSEETARAVATADVERSGYAWAQRVGYYPHDIPLEPCSVDTVAGDGWSLTADAMTITAVGADGHCDGHLCYLLENADGRVLFSGDQVFWGGRIGLQNLPDSRVSRIAESMRRLDLLETDGLFPGHGLFSVTGGSQHIRSAMRIFDSLGVPPNIA